MTEKKKQRYQEILENENLLDILTTFSIRNKTINAMHKAVMEATLCSDCGGSGGVKTGEDEYSTCQCQNTTPSPMDKLVEWLEGEVSKAGPPTHDYYEGMHAAFKEILTKAKELHAERR